jgi:transcription elongation factor GreA
LFAEIEEQLGKAGLDLNDFYKNIFLMPQRSPALFHWLLRRVGQGIFSEFLKPAYLPRLINSLNYIKDIKQTFLKVINLEKFDQLIKEARESDLSQIRDAFAKCTTLKEFEKNNYLKIIDYHFPEMQSQKEDFVYTTPEALKRKKQELEHLLTVEIPKNKAEISRAREYGDLSENFEYKAARERQDQLYQRVRMIESELQKVKIIDFKNLDFSKVCIGAKVSLKNLEDNKVVTYAILGRWDTDLSRNIISNESPVARNLLEKKIGDRIVIDEKTFEISKIEPIDS